MPLVTSSAGLSAAFFYPSCVLGDAPAHGTICRDGPVFAGKVICGVRNETSGQGWLSKVSCNPCRRIESPIAAGHTRYRTHYVDDCRTVVRRAQDRGGEGTGFASQLGDQRGKCARLGLSAELDRVFVVREFLRGLDQVVGIDLNAPFKLVANGSFGGAC